MKKLFVMQPYPHPARKNCLEFIQSLPDGYEVLVSEPKRTIEQNKLMWAILDDIAKLKRWPVNGRLEYQKSEFWKKMLLSSYRKEVPSVTQTLDGSVLLVENGTRDIGLKEWNDWVEFLNSVLAKFEAENEQNQR